MCSRSAGQCYLCTHYRRRTHLERPRTNQRPRKIQRRHLRLKACSQICKCIHGQTCHSQQVPGDLCNSQYRRGTHSGCTRPHPHTDRQGWCTLYCTCKPGLLLSHLRGRACLYTLGSRQHLGKERVGTRQHQHIYRHRARNLSRTHSCQLHHRQTCLPRTCRPVRSCCRQLRRLRLLANQCRLRGTSTGATSKRRCRCTRKIPRCLLGMRTMFHLRSTEQCICTVGRRCRLFAERKDQCR